MEYDFDYLHNGDMAYRENCATSYLRPRSTLIKWTLEKIAINWTSSAPSKLHFVSTTFTKNWSRHNSFFKCPLKSSFESSRNSHYFQVLREAVLY